MTDPTHAPLHCGSFAPGHETHWIPALRMQRSTPVPVLVHDVDGQGVVLNTSSGETWHWFHHDEARLAAVAQPGVWLSAFPRLSLLAPPSIEGARPLLCCATSWAAYRPCLKRGDRAPK